MREVTVQEGCSLHEETVQAAQELVDQRRRPRARETRPRSSRPRQQVVVHPLVMAAAKRLRDARPGTRLRIVDSSTVVVE
jgi:hypothetical protein